MGGGIGGGKLGGRITVVGVKRSRMSACVKMEDWVKVRGDEYSHG